METPPEGHWSSGARCPAALGPPFAFRQARRQLARPCGACWRRGWRSRSSPRPGRGRWGARPGRSALSAGRGCGRRRRRRGGRHPRRRRAGRLRPERRAKGLKQGQGERDRFGARLRRGREQVPGPEPEGAAFDSKVQPTSTTGGAPAAITLERGGLAGARSKGAGIPIRDGAANLITGKASALLTSASGHGGWGDRRRPRAQAASLASSPAPSRLAAASVSRPFLQRSCRRHRRDRPICQLCRRQGRRPCAPSGSGAAAAGLRASRACRSVHFLKRGPPEIGPLTL